MQQKELAELLGMTPAAVSKQVKRGMPTESLEKAQRWRKRHLEAGRMKGQRFDPAGSTPAPPVKRERQTAAAARSEAVQARIQIAEGLGRAARQALDDIDHFADVDTTLRAALRQLPYDARPRLPLAIWVALTEHAMHPDVVPTAKALANEALSITADEFHWTLCAADPVMLDHRSQDSFGWFWAEAAADRESFAKNGYGVELEEGST